MKKLSTELKNKIEKMWGLELRLVDKGGKYGSDYDEDIVYNDILGITTPREIKKLESMGAIVYRDVWRIRTTQINITPDNAKLFSRNYPYGAKVVVPSEAWKRYIAKRYRKNIAYEKEDMISLVNYG